MCQNTDEQDISIPSKVKQQKLLNALHNYIARKYERKHIVCFLNNEYQMHL